MTNLGQTNFRRSTLTEKELMDGDYSGLQNTVKGQVVSKVTQGFFCEVLTLGVDFWHLLRFTGPLCSNISLAPHKAEELCVLMANKHYLYYVANCH